ncbi:MAG: methyltransferase domain-containing protein [Chryseolinea sp.]
MNEKEHWDKIASSYNEEIFDVFKSDREGKLMHYFKKHGDKKHTAIDFGCGTGKALPYLSPLFRKVLAVDISRECLAEARRRSYKNVEITRKDLSGRRITLPPSDFVFCCNVIMLPEPEKNVIMFSNVQKAMRTKGNAVLVVPSFDSMMFSAWRMIDWYRKEGVKPANIPPSELAYFSGKKTDLLQGIIKIDGVPTKHYSESELRVLLKQSGLVVTALEKLTYDWDTEFSSPPTWMKDPYPWDWLVECKKETGSIN